MPRVKKAVPSRRRRKKVLLSARGYWGAKSRLFKTAKEAVEKSLLYSYRDRRNKKREFRNLWITRINAAVRPYGFSYSQFVHRLNVNHVTLSRKTLAYLAVTDPNAFSKIIESVSDKS